MIKYDIDCKADKGKRFVLTKYGQTYKSYKEYKVDEPIDGDGKWALRIHVENGVVEEVEDPDWVILPGYQVVREVNGNLIPEGYPYWDKEMAQLKANAFNKRNWSDDKAYVIECNYEGARPKPCRIFEGKTVYNKDWWLYERPVGSLVEADVVDDMVNCVPPACMRSSCMQCGEPYSTRIDEREKIRYTYATFKWYAKGIYEWKGYCFRYENEERGNEIPIVK